MPARSRRECTESSRGRIVHRSLYAEYLDKVRGYHATEAYKKAMRKRQVWVEPLFAEAKVWHGLRRFRLRGLENVNIEGLLVAAGQNLKRLLAATGLGTASCPLWEPRGPPEGATAALSRLRLTIYFDGDKGQAGRSTSRSRTVAVAEGIYSKLCSLLRHEALASGGAAAGTPR